jgi:hypothetical protein
MALQAVTSKFTITGLDTITPRYFWNGSELTEIMLFRGDVDEDGSRIKLRVLNTTHFDVVYAEMEMAGIKVKKV